MFNNELSINTATNNNCPVSTAPKPRYHLLHMPPRGGKPIILKVAIKKAVKVTGIARPKPSSSLTRFLCVATKIAPAAKKSVILAKACIAICIDAPINPALLASIAPRVM